MRKQKLGGDLRNLPKITPLSGKIRAQAIWFWGLLSSALCSGARISNSNACKDQAGKQMNRTKELQSTSLIQSGQLLRSSSLQWPLRPRVIRSSDFLETTQNSRFVCEMLPNWQLLSNVKIILRARLNMSVGRNWPVCYQFAVLLYCLQQRARYAPCMCSPAGARRWTEQDGQTGSPSAAGRERVQTPPHPALCRAFITPTLSHPGCPSVWPILLPAGSCLHSAGCKLIQV